jgi:hypothetical protein
VQAIVQLIAYSIDLEEMNMQGFIGAKLLSSKVAQPSKKPFEIYDSRLSGFTLRVQPTGIRSYYARFGRNRRIALGKVGTLLPDEAREKCQKVLGNVAHGHHPLYGLSGADGPTLGQFIEETYLPWAKANPPAPPLTRSVSSIDSMAVGLPNHSLALP